jgi:predicted esterase
MRQAIACVVLLATISIASATQAEDLSSAADLTLTFTQKSPLSDPAKLARRGGWPLDALRREADPTYDLATESFAAYVPAAYDGSKPFGLMVWINAGPNGDIPPEWKPVLDRHQLIWIGANNGGNPRQFLIRMGMAIDAVENMKARYKIDDDRIYIAGASGGAKVANILGVAWPEVFRGGFYMIGSAHYRDVPTGEPKHFWFKGFNAPAAKLLVDARQRNRHVFFTGEKDINRKAIQDMYAAYKADKFLHLTLLDEPEVGHELPKAEPFEKGVVALDEIPVKVAKPVKKP